MFFMFFMFVSMHLRAMLHSNITFVAVISEVNKVSNTLSLASLAHHFFVVVPIYLLNLEAAT
jgi:hypothetical protein